MRTRLPEEVTLEKLPVQLLGILLTILNVTYDYTVQITDKWSIEVRFVRLCYMLLFLLFHLIGRFKGGCVQYNTKESKLYLR